MCIVIMFFQFLKLFFEVIHFEINLSDQAIFLHEQNTQKKTLYILRPKRAFQMKQKVIFK